MKPLSGAGVALVTGGTRGIGRATAHRLANDGFTVVSVGRSHAEGGQVAALEVDLTEPGAPESMVEGVVAEHGRLDVLVNNAGAMLVDEVVDARAGDWETMTALNLRAVTQGTRAALPHLLEASRGPRGCADLVFLGSLAATVPTPGRAFYAATKSAVRAFADVLRIELANTDVRVAVVSPGLTATSLRDANRPESLAKMATAAPNLQDVPPLHPDRVAETIAWIVGRPRDVSISDLAVMPTRQGR
jgi:NADP-dependent 3-hydroxy acid dehydrogenase YdfG